MNMKKILSIALSLVMIMALFTGCGSNKNAKTKDNGSYFKEVKKMQEIKTGTGEVELSFDVSADSTIGKQYADMKKDTKDVDNAIKKVKDNKDKIVSAIKDSNANIVSKAKVTGDKGSRKGTISIETGEIKNDDASMNISLTSNITEGKPSVKDLVPTENVTDLTSIITMLSSQMSGKGL